MKLENVVSDPSNTSARFHLGFKTVTINYVAKAIVASQLHLYADDTIVYSSGHLFHSAAPTFQHRLTLIENLFSPPSSMSQVKDQTYAIFLENLMA